MSSTAYYHWCVCVSIFVRVCACLGLCVLAVSAERAAEGMDVKHCTLSLVCVYDFIFVCVCVCVCVRAWVYVC